jgi:tetratricopeptide (TPR) repeat protein
MHQAIADYASRARTDPDAYPRMCEYLTEFLRTKRRDPAGFDAIAFERDNVHAALTWCLESQDAKRALALVGELWDYWYQRGEFSAGRKWAEAVLGLEASRADDLATGRAKVLNDAGNYAYNQVDLAAARGYYTEAVLIRRRLGLRHLVAGTVNNLGLIARRSGDYVEADRLFRCALSINEAVEGEVDQPDEVRRQATDWRGRNLNNLGVSAYEQRHYEDAVGLQRKSLEIFTEAGDDWWRAMALGDLANAERRLGDQAAKATYTESLRIRARLKDPRGVALALVGLAELARAQADHHLASEQLVAAMTLFVKVLDYRSFAVALERLAAIESASGNDGALTAARWLGASEKIRRRAGYTVPPVVADEREARTAAIKQQIGEAAFDGAAAEGRSRTVGELMDEARDRSSVPWETVVQAALTAEPVAARS